MAIIHPFQLCFSKISCWKEKIRDTELMKVPYMLVIGEKEMNEGQLSIRRQGKGDLGTVALNSFIESIKEEILERKSGD